MTGPNIAASIKSGVFHLPALKKTGNETSWLADGQGSLMYVQEGVDILPYLFFFSYLFYDKYKSFKRFLHYILKDKHGVCRGSKSVDTIYWASGSFNINI